MRGGEGGSGLKKAGAFIMVAGEEMDGQTGETQGGHRLDEAFVFGGEAGAEGAVAEDQGGGEAGMEGKDIAESAGGILPEVDIIDGLSVLIGGNMGIGQESQTRDGSHPFGTACGAGGQAETGGQGRCQEGAAREKRKGHRHSRPLTGEVTTWYGGHLKKLKNRINQKR